MARRIYIKDGGLNTSPTIPPGYTALGTNGGELKKKVVNTISDIGGGGSSKTRVDVVSTGFKSNTTTDNITRIQHSNWENLLWEIVDSSGNYLVSEKDYSISATTLYDDLVNYVITLGLDITVRGYYYLDQSKEKFRIVGRNLAYWSLVGKSNYARMRKRGMDGIGINPGTLGQNIITALNAYSSNVGYESLAYITGDGQGLAFSSMKSDKLCKSYQHTGGGVDIRLHNNIAYNTYGIVNGSSTLVLLSGLTNIDQVVYSNFNESLLLSCDRNGGVTIYTGAEYNFGTPQSTTILKIYKIKVFTPEYPPVGDGGGLFVWGVKPISQDVFLLNNNSSILSDDKVYLIPEDRYKNVYFPANIDIYNKIDDTGFGQDLTNDATKTGLDRYRNIRVENIPGFGDSDKVLKDTYSKSIKWRVAYGKVGNFTLSDEYIIVKSRNWNSNGFTAMVNRYSMKF